MLNWWKVDGEDSVMHCGCTFQSFLSIFLPKKSVATPASPKKCCRKKIRFAPNSQHRVRVTPAKRGKGTKHKASDE